MRLIVAALAVMVTAGATHAEQQPAPPPVEIVHVAGHVGRISAVAFSPDGKTIATGGGDYKVKLWDAATGLMLRTLDDHLYNVIAVSFSTDGKHVLSASVLGPTVIMVSEASTGRLLHRHEIRLLGRVEAAAFSPDGRVVALAAGSFKEDELLLLDTTTGATSHRVKSPRINRLAFSPDGRLLAAVNNNQTATLWDPARGTQVRRLGAGWLDWLKKGDPDDRFRAIAFSSDGRKLAAIDRATLTQFDVSSGRTLATHKSDGYFDTLAYSPDGRMLVASTSTRIEVIDATSGDTTAKFDAHTGLGDTVVAFSPDGRVLASGGSDGAKLWDPTSWKVTRAFAGLDYTIGAIAVTWEGRTVASDSFRGLTVLWDIVGGQFLRAMEGNRKVSSGSYQYAYGIGFSPDGRLLASGSRPQTILIWDTATGKIVRSLKHPIETGARSVAFAPPGLTLALGAASEGREPNIREFTPLLWNVAASSVLRTFDFKPRQDGTFMWTYPLAISADGRLVAAGSRGDVLNVFEAGTGRLLHALKSTEFAPHAVAFSTDGKMLAGGSGGAFKPLIELWDMETGKPLRSFSAHTKRIRTLAFSPDDRVLASGGEDNTIRLWNHTDGKEIGSLPAHSGWVTSLTFTKDGRLLVTAGSDGMVKIWRSGSWELLASLVAGPDGEWTAFTPEGFFAASGRGSELAIVRGLEAVPAETAYDALHRPDLVRDKLAGDPQGSVKAAAAALDLARFLTSAGKGN